MATATTTASPRSASAKAPVSPQLPLGDQCVSMLGVGWEGYETLLEIRGDRSRPKFIYVDGDLFLVSPALLHERPNHRIGLFVDLLILRLRLPSLKSGQTTFRRRKKQVGVEGDHTYYLANEPQVRGKMQIDLRIDPPPDLAIEVVNTHTADAALEVYQRLGVSEVWVCEAGSLEFLIRGANGRYSKSPNSLAFPFLASAELLEWMDQPYSGSDFEWMEAVERWIVDVLAPRFREMQDREKAARTGTTPIDREAAVVLATQLIERQRPEHKVSVRSVRDEGNKWHVALDIEAPPGKRTPYNFAFVHVYKKTGVVRRLSQR